ncbi:MAG TPA: uracil-DNA glycosylase family protein [Spirochaetota bacterium]|nr:uracil-DNA glycosylase family protein [Spirochaetota bacterium]
MQKDYNIKKALAFLLKEYGSDSFLFRNVDELEFLKSWLKNKNPAPSLNEAGSVTTPEMLIKQCSRCGEIVERKVGYGTGINGVMVVLNAPRMANRVELRIHRAESADLLRKMMNAIGIELHECYVTNLIKCESSDPFVKPSDMLRNCLDVLKAEIDMLNPDIVIVMGEIIPIQSIVKSVRGISWYNTEHTISLIKNPGLKRPAWETLKIVKKKFQEIHNG